MAAHEDYICKKKLVGSIHVIIKNLKIDFGIRIEDQQPFKILAIPRFELNLNELFFDVRTRFEDTGNGIIDLFLDFVDLFTSVAAAFLRDVYGIDFLGPEIKQFLREQLVGKTFEDLGIDMRP